MVMRSAWLSGITAVAAVAWSTAPSPEIARASDRCRTTVGCESCHRAIYDEWSASAHARAWTNPTYQAALRRLEQPERCHGCHAPEPVLARLGRPPRARAENREHGVRCESCHDSRGRIAGPFGAETTAHPSQLDPTFSEDGSVHLCGSCHDLRIGPVLPLARDFRAAELARRGKSCIGCHMPRVTRALASDPETGAPTAAERRGRSHALRGPSDPGFCAEAFKLGVRADADRLELSIGNRAGHRVPGLTTRRFEFELLQLDAVEGAVLRRDRVTISADNPIWVAETRRFRFPLEPAAQRAEIVVWHRATDVPAEIDRAEFDLGRRDRNR